MGPVPPRSPARGLSAAEAADRLRAEGPNALPSAPPRSLPRIMLEVAREPMMQLLAAAGGVYLLLGEASDAAMLLAFIVPTAAISVIQQQRTERALRALQALASPQAWVLREGRPERLPAEAVVRGDLLKIHEGDCIAADAVLIEAADLQADESLLTGESVPVRKRAAPDPGTNSVEAQAFGPPGGEDSPCVWAGTLVVRGQGLARVVATGARSQMGRIGEWLGALHTPPTPLALRTRQLVRVFGAVGLGLSAAVVLLHGLTHGDWLAAALAGITLAMSLLPEEFPLILTVFMAMGAWRLSRHRVLARRAAAVEALGAATVLCADKTGTLTTNRMEVAALVAAAPPHESQGQAGVVWRHGEGAPPRSLHTLLRAALRACESSAFDPMEQAIERLCASAEVKRQEGETLIHEYPLLPGQMAMTHVWRLSGGAAQGSPCVAACKGAPETVAALCGLQGETAHALLSTAQALAGQGLRVLAVAQADLGAAPSAWLENPATLGLRWLGLVALADPLRPGVGDAVQQCHRAGLRVVMITGDHPATALAIAREAGLCSDHNVLTGSQIDPLDEPALRERLAQARVIARVTPAHKLRIVQALRTRGEVVAMTGDGVNDAPALKAAHIGIAMGLRGTEVARQAAAVVLLDDDFGSLVKGVQLGRRIDDNLRKAMAFVLAVHVPIAALTLLPLLAGWPPLLMPTHVALLELVVDPVCSIVFENEAEESDVMARPPRDPRSPLLGGGLVASALAQGALVTVGLAVLQGTLLAAHWPEAQVRAVVFTALVGSIVAMILVNRSFGGPFGASTDAGFGLGPRRLGRALAVAMLAIPALMGLVLATPQARALFRLDPIGAEGLMLALASAMTLGLALSALRAWMRPGPARAPS